MENEKLNVLRQIVEEGFGNADLYVIDQLIDDNYIEHQFGMHDGKAGLKKTILGLAGAFSNHRYELIQASVSGDIVWVHYKSSGEHTTIAYVIGWVLVAGWFLFAFAAIRQFALSKNTLVTIKPASSLQTTGVYTFTRNPMYLSLILLYSGIAVFVGNWWTFLLLPMLIIVIQFYVIRKEERYLQGAFGTQYEEYKRKVRPWI